MGKIEPSKLALRLALSLALSGLAFCASFLAAGAYYNHFVAPELVKEYPHDGQIGLGGFIGSINFSIISAVVVLVFAVVWSFKTARRESQNR